ncbi:energy transducer TonB, partial [Bordetella pertussis]
MPSPQSGRSFSSHTSLALRAGAGFTVLALHAAVIGAVFLSKTERPELLEPEAVMVSIIEAPLPQLAQAEPTPEPPTPVEETPPEP